MGCVQCTHLKKTCEFAQFAVHRYRSPSQGQEAFFDWFVSFHYCQASVQEMRWLEQREIARLGMLSWLWWRDDVLAKTLMQGMSAMEARCYQRDDYWDKKLIQKIAKSIYMIFAVTAAGVIAMPGKSYSLAQIYNERCSWLVCIYDVRGLAALRSTDIAEFWQAAKI